MALRSTLLLALLWGACIPLFAQTFQTGLRWEYVRQPWMPLPTPQINHLEITGDTTIQGTTWFKLETELYACNVEEPRLIREEGSRVYYFSGGQEYLLYDYALNPGDTLWQTYEIHDMDNPNEFAMTTYPLVIEDTLSVWLGGDWRKVQYLLPVDNVPYATDIGELIIEGFGFSFYFFPRSGLCETATCLRAVLWPNGDTTLVEDLTDCLISSARESSVVSNLRIQPNPVQDRLFVEGLSAEETTGFLYDLHGRLLFQFTSKDIASGIPTHRLQPGLYFLEIRQEGKQRTTLRFLKE